MATHRRRKKGRGGPGTPPGARCWPGFRARPRASCLFEQQIAHCTADGVCPRPRSIPPFARGERGDQGLSSDAMASLARASTAYMYPPPSRLPPAHTAHSAPVTGGSTPSSHHHQAQQPKGGLWRLGGRPRADPGPGCPPTPVPRGGGAGGRWGGLLPRVGRGAGASGQ